MTAARSAIGQAVATVLATSWRKAPAPCSTTPQQLDLVAPRLIGSGAAALGWWRIDTASALPVEQRPAALRDAMRRLAINDTLRERALARIVASLNERGIVPLIFKGWAVARHYAESYLRPYGDFDLLVRPAEIAAARDVLERIALPRPAFADPNVYSIGTDTGAYAVDFHDRLSDAYATDGDGLFARARRVVLPGGAIVLTACPEDHLRIVILHFLRHGGWRPLWLCDVGAMTEAADEEFDWDLFFTSDPRIRAWLEATIAAAIELLGCAPRTWPQDTLPICPAWLIDAILAEWEAPYAARAMPPSGTEFHDPLAWLRGKWPNPIRATLLRGAPPTSIRQRHHQLALFAGSEIPRALVRGLRRAWWQQLRSRLLARGPDKRRPSTRVSTGSQSA